MAGFYLAFDLCKLRWLAFPLVVVGMNSITIYMMGQLIRGWTIGLFNTHIGWLLPAHLTADDIYGPITGPTAALILFWLVAYWMYRQKFFVRV